ncbi:lysophospholipid acyltransferase family protein [Isoptericola hypogeus]|uniref:Lysophospholipid acyltransferase family protein n=1 Tax=Isoptericola hypogeus TaxID=300179 RepID=A0ABP4URH2_9MICO
MPIARPESRAYRAVARVVRPLMFALVRYDWDGGAENLPRTGGFIAAANHVTELDAVTLAHYLFDHGFEPRILAKRGLFTAPLVGSVLRATRMIPVDRGTAAAARSLEAAAEQLGDGACVTVLPEGTLTRDPDLWPMEGKTGLARMALTSRLPVVPVAQWGAHRVLPRYGRLPRPFPRKRVTIVAGPPVDLSDLYDRPLDTQVLREATNRVMDAITAQLAQIRAEQAPAARFDLRKHPEYEAKRTTYPPVERP